MSVAPYKTLFRASSKRASPSILSILFEAEIKISFASSYISFSISSNEKPPSSCSSKYFSGQGRDMECLYTFSMFEIKPSSPLAFAKTSRRKRKSSLAFSYSSSINSSMTSDLKSSRSSSDAILKAASKSKRSILSFTILIQKLSIVEIRAVSRMLICFLILLYSLKFFSSFIFSKAFSRDFFILSFIPAAAALVKVMMSRSSMLYDNSSSNIRLIILSTKTAVFPLPAAADTNIFLPLIFMAASWFFVHGIILPPYPP